MSRVLKEVLFACGAIGLALLFIINSVSLSHSAALLPRILAFFIIFLSALMVYHAVKEQKRMIAAGETEKHDEINLRVVCTFLVIIVAYVALVTPLGYFIATPVFIVGSYMYLRAVSVKVAILVAVGFSVLVYVVFVKLLYLPVPMGLLERFM